jgi:DNA-binding beta-propeller fold protein YncE
MHYVRWQRLILMVALVGIVGIIPAYAGPLAVVANFSDPGRIVSGPPWPPGTVTIIDTETDQFVALLQVGANPMAVAITPDGKTAVVACAQSSELYFIDLTANPPKVTGKLAVGSGSGDTFYPAGLAMSPDSQYVAVTSMVGSTTVRSTQISRILVVSVKDQILLQDLNLKDFEAGHSAETAAISPKGSIILVGPNGDPPVIFALGYADGVISVPDPDDDTTQMGGFQGVKGHNIALSPGGGFALVPIGNSYLDSFRIDDTGHMTVRKDLIDSGGTGAHSVAISPDGKLAYVRNMLPPRSNIAVFQIDSTLELVDTGQRLACPGIPQIVATLMNYALGFVGSQTIALTPDGKKLYAANPFGGTPTAANLFQYGDGDVLVFNAGSPSPARTIAIGKNPIAVAIQSLVPQKTP